jgi:hypothetical protein
MQKQDGSRMKLMIIRKESLMRMFEEYEPTELACKFVWK